MYPVTAIMQRQTAAALYLTLENAAGETSQLGVTAEHPLFDVAAGWTQAGELVAGDQVADADMQPLTVLAIAVDDTPQLVHNLEVGGANTYFAGDMAAWAHNRQFGAYIFLLRNGQFYSGMGPRRRCRASIIERMDQTGSSVAWYLWWPANSLREQKVLEDQLICDTGGPGSPGNLNARNGPGRKLR